MRIASNHDSKPFTVTTTWCPDDVLELRPHLTDEEAEQALRDVAKVLHERMVEEGWTILEDALFFSGYERQ